MIRSIILLTKKHQRHFSAFRLSIGHLSIDIPKIKIIIDRNLKKIHTIKDVAKEAKVSAETLRKDFLRKEHLGLSHYIVHVKIQKIKEKLATTDEKCLSICLDLGLREDVGARLFKKHTGTTMVEFRAQHKDGRQEK